MKDALVSFLTIRASIQTQFKHPLIALVQQEIFCQKYKSPKYVPHLTLISGAVSTEMVGTVWPEYTTKATLYQFRGKQRIGVPQSSRSGL